MSIDYLKRILTSKVYDVAVESALEPAPLLSQRISNNLLLKREDTQAVSDSSCAGRTKHGQSDACGA
jgi:threonine dehydratase